MSKARTLADFISDGSEFADGTISVAEVSGAAPLASPSFTGTPKSDTFFEIEGADNALLTLDETNGVAGGAQSTYISMQAAGAQTAYLGVASSGGIMYVANKYGPLQLMTGPSGTESSRLLLEESSGAIFNEDSNDYDFRVESDNEAFMLFVNAGSDIVGIGAAAANQAKRLRVYSNSMNAENKFLAEFSDGSNTGNDGGVLISSYLPRLCMNDLTTSSKWFDWKMDTNKLQLGYGANTDLYTREVGGILEISTTDAVFNQGGQNRDFRVESDGNAHMLFVDAGNNTVGIGNSSPTEAGLVVDSIGTDVNTSARLALKSNETSVDTYLRFGRFGTGVDPSMTITNNYYRTSSGYVADDTSYGVTSMFFGDGEISFGSNQAGTASPLQRMVIKQSEVVVNEQSYDNDFRVESDGASHMLFVDAANGTLGINNSSPEVIADIGRNSTTGFSNTADQRSQMALTIRNGSEASGRFVGMNLIAGGGAQSDWSINNVWQSNYVGKLAFKTRTGANSTDWRQILAMTAGNEVVFNEDSTDIDFRVESDNNTNAMFIDASESKVVFNNNEARSNTGGVTIYSSDGGNQDYWDQAKSALVLAGYPSGTAGRGTGLSFYNEANDFHNGYITVTNSVNYNYYTEMAFGVLRNGTNLKTNVARLTFTPWGNSLYTSIDNTFDLGMSALRWKVVYAGTGTINTSDENEKQDIRDLNQAELNVATALKGMMKAYRWRDAVAEKGDDARIHVGVIAQDVEAAFAAEGLDAHRYGMFCEDTWMEKDGEYQKPIDEEGNYPEGCIERTRLGVRYDQILAFVIAAL